MSINAASLAQLVQSLATALGVGTSGSTTAATPAPTGVTTPTALPTTVPAAQGSTGTNAAGGISTALQQALAPYLSLLMGQGQGIGGSMPQPGAQGGLGANLAPASSIPSTITNAPSNVLPPGQQGIAGSLAPGGSF